MFKMGPRAHLIALRHTFPRGCQYIFPSLRGPGHVTVHSAAPGRKAAFRCLQLARVAVALSGLSGCAAQDPPDPQGSRVTPAAVESAEMTPVPTQAPAPSAPPVVSQEPPEIRYALDRSYILSEVDIPVTVRDTGEVLDYRALLDEVERQAEEGEYIDLLDYQLAPTQIADLKRRCTDRTLMWALEVDSVPVSWDTVELDFSDHDLASLDVDMAQLLRLPEDLERVDMCGCGYTNDEMAALQDRLPGLKLIWEIVLSHWTIRTDAVAFSTMKTCSDPFFLYDDEAKYLKYCTELVALDLGHNHVCDLSFLQYMPELKILILVDNGPGYSDGKPHRLTDLSMLQYLPKLEYLEFFVGHVSDLSFLQYTPELVDLNISYNPVSDASYLSGLPKLERLWMEHTYIPYADYAQLCETYPDAKIVYYGEGSIDQGWRTHERYYAMRDMFKNNYIHPLFMDEAE